MTATLKAKKPTKKSKPDSAFLKRLRAEAEPWTDNMTQVEFLKKPVRMFTAATYQAAADEFTNWLLEPHGLTIKDMPVAVGDVKFDRMTLPAREDIRPGWGFFATPKVLPEYEPVFLFVAAKNKRLGSVAFDDAIHIPRLTHPRHTHPWMSYTFSELLSLRPGIRAATGHVLIGGLGMGWVAREIIRKPGVKSVTIIEQDLEIARFFGAAFEKDYPDVKIIVDDAFAYAEQHGHRFDRIIMDIWDDYGNQYDRRWLHLKQKFGNTKTKLWQWA